MRSLELLFTFVLVAQLVVTAWFGRRESRAPALVAFLALALAIAQIGIEGYRWQMIPLYAYSIIVAFLSLKRMRQPRVFDLTTAYALKRIGLGIALLLVLVALPVYLPVPELPTPTGPFDVGTFSFDLTDAGRAEIYGAGAGEARRVLVRVWYPAEPGSGAAAAPWIDNIEQQIPTLAASGGLPAFMFGHLRFVEAHAMTNAPIANAHDRYPLLHFSHGYGGFNSQGTFLTEELASHGYIVVSTEHPYAALGTIFPDGNVAAFDPNTLPEDVPDDVYDRAAKRLLTQWVADISYVQRYLQAEPASGSTGLLSERVDWDRIGLLGHSTGGAAAIQYCAEVSQCKAIVALDPWLQPVSDAIIETGVNQAGLYMFSDPEAGYFEAENGIRFQQFYRNLESVGCAATIIGTGHHDFDDTGTFSPVSNTLGHSKGPLPIRRSFEIVRVLTREFFDQALMGKPSENVTGSANRFPEVRITCVP